MHIQKLRPTADSINICFYSLAKQINQNASQSIIGRESSELFVQIQKLTAFVEKHCQKRKGTPGDLSTTSFRIFLWLRFLSQEENFKMHLSAIEEFQQLIIQNGKKLSIDPNKLLIKIEYSTYLYHRQTNKKETVLQINEGFIASPPEIKNSIITASFSRRASAHMKEVKAYTSNANYQGIIRLVSGHPVANLILCRGELYDLSSLFQKINNSYFDGRLPQPRLIWGSRRAVRRLGYFHPDIHTIAINKRLDDKKIPQLLVEYILYHEMLHQNIGIRSHNGRRYAHTAIFKKEEKKFRNYKEAENLIKLLYK